MYFTNINKKPQRKNKKIKVKVESNLNTKTVDFFLNQYPQLSAGRKNYKKKEIAIAKNICLTKLYEYAKKRKLYLLKKFILKKKQTRLLLQQF